MAEKNDNTIKDIREGLVQFIGALFQNTAYTGSSARQVVCAALIEEALKLVTQDDKIEYFSAKPIVRATLLILQQRKKEYSDFLTENPEPETAQYIIKALQDIQSTEKLLNNIINIQEGEKRS